MPTPRPDTLVSLRGGESGPEDKAEDLAAIHGGELVAREMTAASTTIREILWGGVMPDRRRDSTMTWPPGVPRESQRPGGLAGPRGRSWGSVRGATGCGQVGQRVLDRIQQRPVEARSPGRPGPLDMLAERRETGPTRPGELFDHRGGRSPASGFFINHDSCSSSDQVSRLPVRGHRRVGDLGDRPDKLVASQDQLTDQPPH